MFKKQKDITVYRTRPDRSIYDEWATTKTAEGFFSFIDRLPNPDVVLRKTGRGIGVLRALTNHYQVGTCIESRKAGTKSCDYGLAESSASTSKYYDFYKDVYDNIDIDRLIDDILDAPMYGYNPIEIVWEKDGNYIIPVKAVAKPLEWFYFNSDGEFFFKDRTKGGKRKIDLEGCKFLLPRNKADYLNPYGQATLSRCFWNVAFINGGMEFWVKFTETLGMPYIFGKYDRSMTDVEQQDFLSMLSNLVQNAVGLIPSDGSVEVMQTGSSGNSDIYEKLVEKCENNISKAILGQTLTTDIGNTGSYAASQTHACVRADIVNSDKKLIKKTINRLLKMINEINFRDNNAPEFDFIAENNGLQKAERDNKVYNLGFEFSQDYIIRAYGYEKGDIIPRNTVRGAEFEDYQDDAERQQNVKQDQREQILESVPNTDKLLTPVIEFFNKTRNAEEALEKIAELYPEMDTKNLEKMLTKVIFISDLTGRLSASSDIKKEPQ